MNPMLHAENVSKTFRGRRGASDVLAVREVTLSAQPGDFVAIVGESGSGKSTLARMLLGLYEPNEGEVFWQDQKISRLKGASRSQFRRDVQAVLQDPAGSLNPRKTVHVTIGEALQLHRLASSSQDLKEKVVNALESVGLVPGERFLHRYPHELSGGQRQRVLLARAVSLGPKIIVADEAVSALDASVKVGVLKLMLSLQKRLGVGYVLITHDLPVARKVADYIYVMKNGYVVESGRSEAIFSSPEHPYTATLLSAAPSLNNPRRSLS